MCKKSSSRCLRVEFLGDVKKSDFLGCKRRRNDHQVLPIVYKIAQYKIYALSQELTFRVEMRSYCAILTLSQQGMLTSHVIK